MVVGRVTDVDAHGVNANWVHMCSLTIAIELIKLIKVFV